MEDGVELLRNQVLVRSYMREVSRLVMNKKTVHIHVL